MKVVIFEPVSKHWKPGVEPLAILLLARGFEVTICVPSENSVVMARCRQQCQTNSAKVVFVKQSLGNLWRLLFVRWDLVFLSNRCFESKLISFRFKGFCTDLSKKMVFFGFLLKRTKIVLNLHQISWFSDYIVKADNRLLIWLQMLLRRLYNRRIKAINVYDMPLREQILENNYTDKPVLVAPTIFLENNGNNSNTANGMLRVVIPGRIDFSRRDYGWLERLPEHLCNAMRFILLGTPNYLQDAELLKRIEKCNWIQTFCHDSTFIDEATFEDVIKSSDLLLTPVRLKFNNLTVGKDKGLGALFDAVRYGKPLLLPKSVPVGQQFEGQLLRYDDDEDLIKKLTRLQQDNQLLRQSRQDARRNAEKFSIEKLTYVDELLAILASRH